MTPEQITALREHYRTWSGGFTPDEMDEQDVESYVADSLGIDCDPGEARMELWHWKQENLLAGAIDPAQSFTVLSLTRAEIADSLNGLAEIKANDARLTVEFCRQFAKEYSQHVSDNDDICESEGWRSLVQGALNRFHGKQDAE